MSCFVSYYCDEISVLPHVSLWSFSFLPGDPGGLKENDTPSTGAVPVRNKDTYIYMYIYICIYIYGTEAEKWSKSSKVKLTVSQKYS